MSESETDPTPEAIDDEQLPEDLRPDDNPLAKGLDDGETVDDLLTGGKHADQDEDGDTSQDDDGAS
ncbi:hypothetical protein [Nocardioides sp.]|uniref:hypothetical protein n=1 Tax=Nocardioides sp. TaxID=35761 RepID=UPI0027283EFC|nr:hypothetical protein [Nocardioides sp.]MDO9458096.1 hypothetical protein [Nocardioides sp.]